MDKAGAYAIQGLASRFVPRIEGSYSNVVGPAGGRRSWQMLETPGVAGLTAQLTAPGVVFGRILIQGDGADVMSKKTVAGRSSPASSSSSALGAAAVHDRQRGRRVLQDVDEVMASPEQWYGKNMQLHGFVVDGSIVKRPSTLDYRFKVKTGDHVGRGTYTGVVPDTFKDGAKSC